ncbi:hypothetical protein R2A130_3408 [Ahrensia sp. R2A130]|nr:hypothetical protein R2A130_3408 [Ahrensia sp. R2A130]
MMAENESDIEATAIQLIATQAILSFHPRQGDFYHSRLEADQWVNLLYHFSL